MSTHPDLLSATSSVLVVIDIQTNLTAVMEESEAEKMIAHTGILMEAAERLHIPILLTEQYPQGLGVTQAEIVEKLSGVFQVFDKTSFSCCAAEGFSEALELSRRQQIVLVGQEAHVCVLQTALELLNRGFQVHVVGDALCSRKGEHKFFALQRMQQQGATITNHESVLFEWLGDAKHPEFKRLSALLS
jgi:nicotinamidase-related amidase